jgi:hypothetical protein
VIITLSIESFLIFNQKMTKKPRQIKKIGESDPS